MRTAERAREKLNLEPKYQKPSSWAEFQLPQELKTQENGELFLQHDSGTLGDALQCKRNVFMSISKVVNKQLRKMCIELKIITLISKKI